MKDLPDDLTEVGRGHSTKSSGREMLDHPERLFLDYLLHKQTSLSKAQTKKGSSSGCAPPEDSRASLDGLLVSRFAFILEILIRY